MTHRRQRQSSSSVVFAQPEFALPLPRLSKSDKEGSSGQPRRLYSEANLELIFDEKSPVGCQSDPGFHGRASDRGCSTRNGNFSSKHHLAFAELNDRTQLRPLVKVLEQLPVGKEDEYVQWVTEESDGDGASVAATSLVVDGRICRSPYDDLFFRAWRCACRLYNGLLTCRIQTKRRKDIAEIQRRTEELSTAFHLATVKLRGIPFEWAVSLATFPLDAGRESVADVDDIFSPDHAWPMYLLEDASVRNSRGKLGYDSGDSEASQRGENDEATKERKKRRLYSVAAIYTVMALVVCEVRFRAMEAKVRSAMEEEETEEIEEQKKARQEKRQTCKRISAGDNEAPAKAWATTTTAARCKMAEVEKMRASWSQSRVTAILADTRNPWRKELPGFAELVDYRYDAEWRDSYVNILADICNVVACRQYSRLRNGRCEDEEGESSDSEGKAAATTITSTEERLSRRLAKKLLLRHAKWYPRTLARRYQPCLSFAVHEETIQRLNRWAGWTTDGIGGEGGSSDEWEGGSDSDTPALLSPLETESRIARPEQKGQEQEEDVDEDGEDDENEDDGDEDDWRYRARIKCLQFPKSRQIPVTAIETATTVDWESVRVAKLSQTSRRLDSRLTLPLQASGSRASDERREKGHCTRQTRWHGEEDYDEEEKPCLCAIE